jgi:hypothetical protein
MNSKSLNPKKKDHNPFKRNHFQKLQKPILVLNTKNPKTPKTLKNHKNNKNHKNHKNHKIFLSPKSPLNLPLNRIPAIKNITLIN